MDTVDVWTAWGAVARDLFILGRDNQLLLVYNVTANDLSVPANYAALKQLLLDAAAAEAD